jgi:hypothetical protein
MAKAAEYCMNSHMFRAGRQRVASSPGRVLRYLHMTCTRGDRIKAENITARNSYRKPTLFIPAAAHCKKLCGLPLGAAPIR